MARRALRRLRARVVRRLLEESYWRGWEEGAVEAVARLAAQVERGA